MIKLAKPPPSLLTLFLIFIIIVASRILLPLFSLVDVHPVFSGDIFGYYLYLPAYFLHHDTGLHGFSWVRNAFLIYHLTPDYTQWSIALTGDYILKFPVGMAVLYHPFFFLGWLFATIGGYAVDGFSYPFQVSMIIGNLFYTFTGLWFLRKILLKFFNEWIVTLTMILVILGTNYFQLAAFDGAMPHNSLFMLFALVVWMTIRWHEKPEWKYAVTAGILTGLSILVKPSSGAILLIPVFWGIFNKASLEKKWGLIKRSSLQVILFFSYVILVYFFQVIYLKLHSGLFFYETYPATEKFQPVAPFLAQVMISFKKGWLIYTPVMIFPLIGFLFLAKKRKEIFYATFLFFIINLLVIASWTNWGDNASFGQSAMIESYVVLSLPAGFFLSALAQKKLWLKILLSTVIIFFVLLNLFQSWQYQDHIIHPSKMTADYYQRVFGRLKTPPGSSYFLEGMEDNDLELLKLEHYSVKNTLLKTPEYVFKLDSASRFSPGMNLKVKEIKDMKIKGIRVTAWFYSKFPIRQNPCHIVVTLNHDGLNYRYCSKNLEETRMPERKWVEFSMDYLVSERADTNDRLMAYIWYPGKYEIFISYLKFEILQLSDK